MSEIATTTAVLLQRYLDENNLWYWRASFFEQRVYNQFHEHTISSTEITLQKLKEMGALNQQSISDVDNCIYNLKPSKVS